MKHKLPAIDVAPGQLVVVQHLSAFCGVGYAPSVGEHGLSCVRNFIYFLKTKTNKNYMYVQCEYREACPKATEALAILSN